MWWPFSVRIPHRKGMGSNPSEHPSRGDNAAALAFTRFWVLLLQLLWEGR